MDTIQQNRTMHGQTTITVALNVLFHVCVLVIIVAVCTDTALATELRVEDREIIATGDINPAVSTELFDGTIVRLPEPNINVNPDHLDFEYSVSVPYLDFTSNPRGPHLLSQEIMREVCASCNSAKGEIDIGVRNPAAVYCTEMGCEYQLEKTENGERGICVMPSNEECDAWAFYSGECGREFSYCTKKGWVVAPQAEKDCFATNCTTCVLPDGSHKTVSELLDLNDKCAVGVNRLNENEKVNNTELTRIEEKK